MATDKEISKIVSDLTGRPIEEPLEKKKDEVKEFKQKIELPYLEFKSGRCVGGYFEVKGTKAEPRIYLSKGSSIKPGHLVYVVVVDGRSPRFKEVLSEDIESELKELLE